MEQQSVTYAIFGAVALNLHGLARFTEDLVERVPFDGLIVSVVTARTLYRMKKDTVRLKDRADAELLRQRFKLDED